MHFLTEVPFIFGIVVTILCLLLVFSMYKPNKSDLVGIKNWNSRDSWQGNVVTVEAKSWSQTDTKYGNDFFYNFEIPIVIDGNKNLYVGKGVVRPDDIHKLKKGIKVVVKYSEDTPPKVAIIDVLY